MFKRLLAGLLIMSALFAGTLTAFADETDIEIEEDSEIVAVSSDNKEDEKDSTSDIDTDNVVSEIASEILKEVTSTDTDRISDTDSSKEKIPDYYGDEKYDTAGNLSLVREQRIIYDSSEMQFIAVTTKDGHIFYILIDYTAIRAAENGEEGSDARQTVYFLNKVDDYDLFTLLYEDTDVDSYYSMPDNNNGSTSTQSYVEEEPKALTETNKSSGIPTWLIMVVVIALAGGGYWFIKIRPNGNKKAPIDDDDFEFDEDEINEDNEADE